MKVEVGKTYKVMKETDEFILGDVFTVLEVRGEDILLDFDHDEAFF